MLLKPKTRTAKFTLPRTERVPESFDIDVETDDQGRPVKIWMRDLIADPETIERLAVLVRGVRRDCDDDRFGDSDVCELHGYYALGGFGCVDRYVCPVCSPSSREPRDAPTPSGPTEIKINREDIPF